MQVLNVKEGDRVKAIRQFEAPYTGAIIHENEEGEVYGIGPCWDVDESIQHLGVHMDNGHKVSVPIARAHIYWRQV